MRSIYAKVALWCFGTLLLSLMAFGMISYISARNSFGRGGPFERMATWQLDEARQAYESGGPIALQDYLNRINHHFGAEHHLVEAASGRDMVTGEDRSAMLAPVKQSAWPPWMWWLYRPPAPLVRAYGSGKYRLAVAARLANDPWNNMAPYYFLVLGAIALMCWLLAFYLASPLRKLALTVDRFGRGDLSARVNSRRRDEIGNVARAFDAMAERMQTLLTAERRLFQDISHELRTPLARLSFAAELSRTAEDRNAATARLKKEISRLTDLVGALLEVTRAEGDPSSRDLTDVQLDDFVREVVEDGAVEAEARGSRLYFESAGPLHFRGDRELLRRAIENIIRNAIRYAPEGTAIEVKLDAQDDNAVISVRDYGPGVPEEELPKIFKPFFRVDESRDLSTGGVGLGLAIAYRAVTVHHGNISARNMNPGLLVSIELPLDPARTGAAPSSGVRPRSLPQPYEPVPQRQSQS